MPRRPTTTLAEGHAPEDVKAAGITDAVWHERDGKLRAFVPFDAYRRAEKALRQITAYDIADDEDTYFDALALRDTAFSALEELGRFGQ